MATNRSMGFIVSFGALAGAVFLASAGESGAENCTPGGSLVILGSAANAEDESGIGGTGVATSVRDPGRLHKIRGRTLHGDDDASGVGGTGHRPQSPDDQGSGVGGTGIFGHITRIQGLCVNGLEIEVAPGLALESSGDGPAEASLAIGQLVWVRAAEKDGSLVATRIVIYSEDTQLADALINQVLDASRGLDALSIEAIISGSAGRPRIGRAELEFGTDRANGVRKSLRPGSRVRAFGRIDPRGRFELLPPPRPDRPVRESATTMPSEAPSEAPSDTPSDTPPESSPKTTPHDSSNPSEAPDTPNRPAAINRHKAPNTGDSTDRTRPVERPRDHRPSIDRPALPERPRRPHFERPTTQERPVDRRIR